MKQFAARMGARKFVRIAWLAFAFLPLAACGGGGGGGSLPGAGAANSTPTNAPANSSSASITGGLSAATATLPSIAGGYGGTFTLPATVGGTAVSATLDLYNSLPANDPTPVSKARAPRSIGVSFSPILYLTLTATTAFSIGSTPGFAFVVPSGLPAGSSAYIAFYDPANAAAGFQTIAGPGIVSGQTISFAPVPGFTMTFGANVTYTFMLFSTAQSVSLASPPPGATAAAAPAVGYLAASGNGFSGQLTSTTSSVTIAGISRAPQLGSPVSLPAAATVNYSAGSASAAASAARIPAYVAAMLGRGSNASAPELPPTGPAEQLAMRARLVPARGGTPSSVARRIAALPTTQGATANIWMLSFSGGSSSYVQVPATLQQVSAHGWIWVDNSLDASAGGPLNSADYTSIANGFETAYISDTTHFGATSYVATSPGMSNGGPWSACDANGNVVSGSSIASQFIAPTDHILVFVANIAKLGNAGGYFGDVNFYPQALANCFPQVNGMAQQSNEAPSIYVGYNTANPKNYELNEDLVRGTAHETQQLISFVNHNILNAGSDEQQFVNEGLSMLAQDLALPAFNPQLTNDVDDALWHAYYYLLAPQNFSITAFAGIDSAAVGGDGVTLKYDCQGCFGGEYLLQRYLYDRFGGDTYTHKMESSTATGFANLAAATGQTTAGLPQVFSDFALAMAASNTGASTDPRFNFTGLNLRQTYTSPFGNVWAFNGPAAAVTLGPATSGSARGLLGGYFYLSGTAALANQVITLSEPTGAFQLAVGVVQH